MRAGDFVLLREQLEILNKTVEFPRKYWNDDVSKEAQDFIMRLLTRDVRKRPSAEAALNHVWLKELKDRRRHAVTDDVRSTQSGTSDGGGWVRGVWSEKHFCAIFVRHFRKIRKCL